MATNPQIRAGLAGLLCAFASCSEPALQHAVVDYPGTRQARYVGALVPAEGGRMLAEGIWRFYWRNGTLQALGDYRSGDPPGAADEFDDHTQVPEEGRSGHWREWSESGALVCEGCYALGKRAGLWFSWYGDGTLRTQGRFVDGRENGEHFTWHSNGVLATQGNFEKGRKQGLQRDWNEQGVLREEATWSAGIRDGLRTHWDEHGVRREQAQYRSGLLHGTRGLWNAKGELTCVSHYEGGLLEGQEELYHANGQVRVRGSYEQGEPVGTWTAWDEEGVLIWSRAERAPRDPGTEEVVTGEKRARGDGGN